MASVSDIKQKLDALAKTATVMVTSPETVAKMQANHLFGFQPNGS